MISAVQRAEVDTRVMSEKPKCGFSVGWPLQTPRVTSCILARKQLQHAGWHRPHHGFVQNLVREDHGIHRAANCIQRHRPGQPAHKAQSPKGIATAARSRWAIQRGGIEGRCPFQKCFFPAIAHSTETVIRRNNIGVPKRFSAGLDAETGRSVPKTRINPLRSRFTVGRDKRRRMADMVPKDKRGRAISDAACDFPFLQDGAQAAGTSARNHHRSGSVLNALAAPYTRDTGRQYLRGAHGRPSEVGQPDGYRQPPGSDEGALGIGLRGPRRKAQSAGLTQSGALFPVISSLCKMFFDDLADQDDVFADGNWVSWSISFRVAGTAQARLQASTSSETEFFQFDAVGGIELFTSTLSNVRWMEATSLREKTDKRDSSSGEADVLALDQYYVRNGLIGCDEGIRQPTADDGTDERMRARPRDTDAGTRFAKFHAMAVIEQGKNKAHVFGKCSYPLTLHRSRLLMPMATAITSRKYPDWRSRIPDQITATHGPAANWYKFTVATALALSWKP
ncbi:hypothetical protein FQR65_LT20726 [Abscondita terminalis]|nr:hypothetical protein FQR65_LT20726 [Abscondita terminalis]